MGRLGAPVLETPEESEFGRLTRREIESLHAPVNETEQERRARVLAEENIGRLRAGPEDVLGGIREQAARHRAYLEAEPYTTTEEQAMRERHMAPLRAQIERAKQMATEEYGNRQGQSGILNQRLADLEEEQRRGESEVARELITQGAAERRSRMAEARDVINRLTAAEQSEQERGRGWRGEALGIAGTLGEAERQRELMGLERRQRGLSLADVLGGRARGREDLGFARRGQALGLGENIARDARAREAMGLQRRAESRDILGGLEGLERQRLMEAMGIEAGLDEEEMRRILMAAQMAGGTLPANLPPTLSGNLLDYASRAGDAARSRLSQGNQNLADLSYLFTSGR